MKAKPILFSAPMVQALLDGRKTQTRRTIKEQSTTDETPYLRPDGEYIYTVCDGVGVSEPFKCPYGKVGDLLWVRENWRIGSWVLEEGLMTIDYMADESCPSKMHYIEDLDRFEKYVDQSIKDCENAGLDHDGDGYYHWVKGASPCRTRPNIFMMRLMSRLTLEITDIRVERLQDISKDDAKAEGAIFKDFGKNQWGQQKRGWSLKEIDSDNQALGSPRFAFANYINEIHGGKNWNLKPTNLWDENPWVWVIEFKVHKQNIDEFLEQL